MDVLCRIQADMLGIEVQRPAVAETTALGAAYLAGLGVGFWKGIEQIEELWHPEMSFSPSMSAADADLLYGGWKKAVERARLWEEPA